MSTSSPPAYIARVWPGHIEILRSTGNAPRERVDDFDITPGEPLRAVLHEHRWRLSGRGFTRRGTSQIATALPVERVAS